MKRYVAPARQIWGWGLAVILVCGAPCAWAASGNADGTYTITVTQVEISKDSGATYTTIFSGSTAINIAAANAGAVAAGLASGVSLTPGTYDRIRVTLGANLSVKGYVNDGDSALYTNNDADGFNDSGTADTTGADYAASTFTIPVGARTATQNVSITVPDGGAAPTVRISFDTSGVITQVGGIPSVGAPTVTITSS